MTPRYALFLGSYERPELSRDISEDNHPKVEYLELIAAHNLDLVTFASPSQLFISRAIAKTFGPLWALAAYSRSSGKRFKGILTMGEDVGIRVAVLQRLTRGALPIYIVTHGSYLGSKKGALALRLLRDWKQVKFLCLSETLRRRLIDRHDIPEARVFNVCYGVDTNFFKPTMPQECQPRQIASAGMANRDYKTLVAATRDLDATVKIAADSAWFRTDTDIAGETLPPNVEAKSYGDYVGLRRLYSESAFVVVPLYEAVHACGYAVIAEAMAMGKPVITTKIRSHSDYIIEGETGFYVPPGNVDALREKVIYLLEHPEAAAAMGKNARQLIESRFTMSAYSDRIALAAGLVGSMPDAESQRVQLSGLM